MSRRRISLLLSCIELALLTATLALAKGQWMSSATVAGGMMIIVVYCHARFDGLP